MHDGDTLPGSSRAGSSAIQSILSHVQTGVDFVRHGVQTGLCIHNVRLPAVRGLGSNHDPSEQREMSKTHDRRSAVSAQLGGAYAHCPH